MSDSCDRRAVLGSLLGAAALGCMPGFALAAPASDPIPFHGGAISPAVPVPDMAIQLSDGSRTSLPKLLSGRASAMHLMFTGCTTTCPIQGVVFKRVQDLVHDQVKRGIQLVSLSVSPLEDTPEAMRAWLARFQAGPGWIAARPTPEGLATLQRFFGVGEGRDALTNHAAEVVLVNKRAEAIWRTYELPSPETLAGMLNKA